MTWAYPERLGLLFLVAALAAIVAWTTRAHHARLAALFPSGFDRRVLPGAVRWRRAIAHASLLGALAAGVVALAEPRFGTRVVDLEAEGVDLVIAVDLSRSMDATDVDPSRLERARREILDLTARLTGDRVGLVIFAGGAYPRMPLTLDYRALELLVRELDTEAMQAQGSNVAEAIREGMRLLDVADAPAGRAIILLSDGEVHRPDAAYAAAREAAAAGVSVYGWIVGAEPSRIPARPDPRGRTEPWIVDPRTGEPAISTPDPAVFEEIARITQGAVVRSVAGTADVEALYDQEIRRRLRATVGRRGQREVFDTQVGVPLGIAALLALLGAWLGDGRRVVPVLVALAVLIPRAHAQDDDVGPTVRAADQAYRAGRPERAVDLLDDLVAANPDDPDLLERLGAARYRAGDARGAAEAFERAAQASDNPDASFNAGNAWWRAGVLERAKARYEEALGRDPSHEPAQRNLQALEQELAARRAAPPPPPPEEGPGEGDQGEGSPSDPQAGEGQGQGDEGDQGPPPDGSPSGQPQAPQDGSGTEQGDAPPPQAGSPDAGTPDPNAPQAESQGASDPQAGSPEDGGAPTPSDGTRTERGTDDAPADLDALTGADGEGAEGDAAPEGGAPGTAAGGDAPAGASASEDASAAQASRILDGVEEGRPRVFVPGSSGELPW